MNREAAVHHNFHSASWVSLHNGSMKLLLLSIALSGALLAQEPFQVKVTGHGRPGFWPAFSSAPE
jgi:hypothetical protein